MRNTLKVILPLIASVILLAGCKVEEVQERPLILAPVSALSDELQQAPASIQEAYRFALANPDVLKQIPCYCGCAAVGHTSNYDCYVAEENSDGSPVFDTHGFGWGICVDITRDVMQMYTEGKSIEEMRAAIDRKYEKFGPSNMPWVGRVHWKMKHEAPWKRGFF